MSQNGLGWEEVGWDGRVQVDWDNWGMVEVNGSWWDGVRQYELGYVGVLWLW